MTDLTCIIPCYNEARIQECVDELRGNLPQDLSFEIIVVDDASEQEVKVDGAKVIRHPRNMGYGAAIKSGLLKAEGERVLIVDADGTYPLDRVPDLLEGGYDMVVGSRTGENVSVPLLRRPAKWMLTTLANYLSGVKIPDLNSGFRVFNRELAFRFSHLYPRRFSFTTTITLAFHSNDLNIRYVPIDYHRRSGKSKIRPVHDMLNFILLIIRTILYFNPLKVFLPASLLLLVFAALVFLYSLLFMDRVMDISTILLVVTSVEVALFGLLADLIVKKVR